MARKPVGEYIEEGTEKSCRHKNYGYEDDFTYDEKGISLRELLLVLIKNKKLIAVVTVIVMIAAFLGSLIIPNISIGSKGEVQSAFKLYFDGIENGMTPDGLEYDPNEIKAAEVVQEALNKMALKNPPSTSQVAACISLTSVLPEDAAKTLQNISSLKTEQLKLERLESLEINPNTYIVTLNVKNSLGLSLEEGRELLDNIFASYRQQLLDKYSDYQVLADVFKEGFSIDNYDYIQAADLLSEQLMIMEEYVKENITDQNFVSKVTGESRLDMLNSIEAMKSVDIELIYTKIAVSYATKDAEKSVAVYEKLAEDKEKIYRQYSEEANSLYSLINNFKEPEQTLILGNGSEEPYTLKNQSQQYDSMVTRYIQSGIRATDALADSKYYKAEAERYRNAQSYSGAETKAAEEIEKLIERSRANITQAIKKLNTASEEYYSVNAYKEYAEQLLPAQSYEEGGSLNLPLNMAVALAAGLILGILIVLFREYLKTEEQEEGR